MPLTVAHSVNAGILYSDLMYCSGEPERPSGGNHTGFPAQATYCADRLGSVHDNSGIECVQGQQIPDSVGSRCDSDDGDEWLGYLFSGTPDNTIATGTVADDNRMAEYIPGPVSSPPSSETWQRMFHQSVSIPSDPQQLYPNVSPPATTNVQSPKRTKIRMRWTVEMHDRFIDAINQLGGSENAKPKAILDLMNVEGLTREHVKSHLQKYKLTQARHHPSEGTSIETTYNEVAPSDVQMSLEAFALQMQMEFQKKLHDMVKKTHSDLVEIHNKMLEKHVADLHELETRRVLSLDRSMVHLSSRATHGTGSSSNALKDTDGRVPSTIALRKIQSPDAGGNGDPGAVVIEP
ncbi:hypothetical protein ACP4OV_004495 [Aristida adscensionis]